MKKTILTILLLTITNLFYAQTQNAIEEIAIYLSMTGNYQQATECYEHLLANESTIPTASLHNNIGINLVFEVLSMFSLKESKEEIIFIFPFEIAPGGTKGGDERRAIMEEKLELAIRNFQGALDISPEMASAKLNYASALTLLGRMRENDQTLYAQAIQKLRDASELARQQNLPDTEGNTLILEGIIYHYLRREERGNQKFEQAAQFSNARVQHITENNLRILRGEAPSKGSGEKYDIFGDEDETIAGRSIRQIINRFISGEDFESDATVMTYKAGNAISSSNLYVKSHTNADLYLYLKGKQSEREPASYILLFKTTPAYSESSGKGIQSGDRSEKVYDLYGVPAHIHSAQGGRYLYYEKADIIFFVNSQDRVEYWAIWGQKRG